MTNEQLVRRLEREVAEAGTKADVARKYRISQQYFGEVLRRSTPISDRLARAMGYRREFRFVRLENGQ